jgi:secreted PhoX family phosphatase
MYKLGHVGWCGGGMSADSADFSVENRGRRTLLRGGFLASGLMALGYLCPQHAARAMPPPALTPQKRKSLSNIPNLAQTLHEVEVEHDPQTRMRIPKGFAVREVARSGVRASAAARYAWHGAPDGGACFSATDGGWIYVSNSEIGQRGRGGVGALRFASTGELIDSYPICSGTTTNCAGGPTPWGTWLTCEEIADGLVYECDPTGATEAVAVPALGVFKHEAVAVDHVKGQLYLTEDTPDSNFYRFTPDKIAPDGRLDLRSGRLDVAVADLRSGAAQRRVTWQQVPNPVPRLGNGTSAAPTRKQVSAAARFNGGEGCWYHEGWIYLSTKGDNRVWALDTRTDMLGVIYDAENSQTTLKMDDVDNITGSGSGDILVAEDGRGMRLIVVSDTRAPFELVHVLGHPNSEICGPAFSPDGSRLYFSSQRGPGADGTTGRTYEVRGPFFADA